MLPMGTEVVIRYQDIGKLRMEMLLLLLTVYITTEGVRLGVIMLALPPYTGSEL